MDSEFYDVPSLITELGIGEAFMTALDEKGIPTPLVHIYLRAPQSRMDILSDLEIDAIINKSHLVRIYNEEVDRESAYEILSGKIEAAASEEHQAELQNQQEEARRTTSGRQEKGTLEKMFDSPTTRQIGRTLAREFTRGLLGALGVKTTARRTTRRKSSWF